MFCKWCGATLPNGAGRCPRCGKESPALSDCGGFYDLVPNAKKAPAVILPPPPVTPVADPGDVIPPKNDPPQKDTAAKSGKTGRKKNILPQLAILVCLLAIIALLLSINCRLGKILSADARQDEKIDAISKDLSQVADVILGRTPEETTPVETTPVETTPVETTPEETTPEETTPEETTPEETTPEETTPAPTTPAPTTPVPTTPVPTTLPADTTTEPDSVQPET